MSTTLLFTPCLCMRSHPSNCPPPRLFYSFRLHVRHELEQLGMQRLLRDLKTYENEALQRHIEIYESVAQDDLDDLCDAFAAPKLDLNNALSIASALSDRSALGRDTASAHFTALHLAIDGTQHLFFLVFCRFKTAPLTNKAFTSILAHMAMLLDKGPELDTTITFKLRYAPPFS